MPTWLQAGLWGLMAGGVAAVLFAVEAAAVGCGVDATVVAVPITLTAQPAASTPTVTARLHRAQAVAPIG